MGERAFGTVWMVGIECVIVYQVPFDMANPYQCMDAPHSTHLNKEGGWQVARCIQAHSCAISGSV